MATPHLKEGKLSVIDTETWQRIAVIETEGPGFFLRSHENSRYFWSDVFFGPNKDAMHVIDKQSLGIVKTLRPVPGATVAHVEFTRDGSKALVSVWEEEGAIIIYDANSLEELGRLPMRKPSGKYNVWNKITFSEGHQPLERCEQRHSSSPMVSLPIPPLPSRPCATWPGLLPQCCRAGAFVPQHWPLPDKSNRAWGKWLRRPLSTLCS